MPDKRTTVADRAAEIMKTYDVNGDGVLQADEFQQYVADRVFHEDFDAIMALVDKDGDGVINITELRAFLRSYHPNKGVEVRSALVMVDVQNDFISGTLANPYDGEKIIPIINEIRDAFDIVVVSLDWHPHDHCSFVESANDGKVSLVGTEKSPFKPFTMVTLAADAERPAHKQVRFCQTHVLSL